MSFVSAVFLASTTLAGCGGGGTSTSISPTTITASGHAKAAGAGAKRSSSSQSGNGAYAAAVSASGPLAYYTLSDSSSTLTDSGPNSINGTYGSIVTQGAPALTNGGGGAALFPGGTSVVPNSFAYTSPTAALQPSTGSVEAWIQITTASAAKTYTPIVAYGDAKGVAYGLYLQGGGSFDTLYYQQYNAGQSGTLLMHGLTQLKPGIVYHVVATFDGTTASTYINGLPDVSAQYPGVFGYKTQSALGLQIGGEAVNSNFTGDPPFPGSIAQVAVYGSALSQATVLSHYLTGQLLPMVTENATPADSFVDSIGVNVHFVNNNSLYYTNFSQVVNLLSASGIRHFRDRMTFTPQYIALMQQIPSTIHGNFGILPSYTAAQVQGYPATVGPVFEQYEAPNEQDDASDPTWVTDTPVVQQNLYSWVKSNPASAIYPVLGPSLAFPRNYALLPNLSAYMDNGNVHDYMGSYNPGFAGGPWGGMLAMLADERLVGGSKPIMATEAGYGTTSGTDWIDYPTDLRYITRLPFEQFNAGVVRTYFYEFLDETITTGGFLTNGLVDNTLTPKPAYNGIQSIISKLKDPGAPFQTSPLTYNLSGLSTIHHLLFQRHTGSYILAIWQEVPSWNVLGSSAIVVTPQNVTLTTANPFSSVTMSVMNENGMYSTAPLPWSNNQGTIPVTDKVTLVTLTP